LFVFVCFSAVGHFRRRLFLGATENASTNLTIS